MHVVVLYLIYFGFVTIDEIAENLGRLLLLLVEVVVPECFKLPHRLPAGFNLLHQALQEANNQECISRSHQELEELHQLLWGLVRPLLLLVWLRQAHRV